MDIFDLVATLSLDSSKYEDGLKGAESNASSAGSKILGGLGKVGAGVGAVVGATVAGVSAVSGALVNGTTDLAQYADNIDKMSQKMGISAEAYQEWDAVMQHSGTSMETLKASMKTMANAVENNNEAFAQLGITEEQLASMSQEDIFSSVITGLQNMEEGTERTYIAGQLLGRGATELGALLNTTAEETQAMKDRVHELGGVLSNEAVKAGASFQDQLQDMQTAQQSLTRNLLSDFLPSITAVMGGLTDLFAGDYDTGAEKISSGIDNIITNVTEKMPQLLNVGSKIIMSLANSVISNAPKIIKAGISVIKDLSIGLVKALPSLVDSASEIITTVIDTLTETLPTLFPKVLDAVLTLITKLLDHLPDILSSLLGLVQSIAESLLKDGLPMLISKLPDIIMGIVNFVLGAIPDIISAVISIVLALVREFPNIMKTIVKALPQIITGVIVALLSAIPQLVSAGIELFISLITALPEIVIEIVKAVPEIITGIVNGFKESAPQIKEAGKELLAVFLGGFNTVSVPASEFFGNIIETIKGFFVSIGERVEEFFRPAVEKMLAIWAWFDETFSPIINAFKELFATVFQAIQIITERVWSAITEKIREAWDKIWGKISPVIERIKEIIKTGFEFVYNKIKEPLDRVKENVRIGFEYVYSKIKEPLEKAKSTVSDILEKIKGIFQGLIDKAKTWGIDMIQNFIDGIKAKLSALTDTIKNITQTIKDYVGFSEPKKGALSNFHTYAPDMMDLFIKGINDNKAHLQDAVAGAFDFGDMIVGQNMQASGNSGKNSSDKIGANYYTINVNQPVSTPADMLREIRTEAQYGLMIGESLA